MVRNRSLVPEIMKLAINNGKMALIGGPRQVGKTTISKLIFRQLGLHLEYFNWDEISFRKVWQKSPLDLLKGEGIILDEIHKAKNWKTTLKGIFDYNESRKPIIVTGSAKLETFRRGGDSLMGRYFHFRLHPFSLGELLHYRIPGPEEFLAGISVAEKKTKSAHKKIFNELLEFGGFPEPFLKKEKRFLNLWQRGRIETLVRIDLRDLTRIMELGQMEVFCSLIPERVGSVLSHKSLAEDMEVSMPTIKKWLTQLSSLYYLYKVDPFHKKMSRSIKKEGKIYLWDYSEVQEPAKRLENLMANHFLKATHYWTDLGYGDFELNLFRDKEKREVDFVILKDRIPWAIFEIKSDGDHFSPHLDYFKKKWPQVKLAVSLTGRDDIYRDLGQGRYVMSIPNLLEFLP